MQSIRFLIGAGAMLAVSGAAFAADPWPASARPCAAMIDSTARLTCFDQLYAKATAPAAKSAGAAAPAAETTAAAGTAVVAGTAAVKSTPAKAAAIGDEDLKKSTAERAESGAPASVDAQVTALRETRPNIFRISLDNGQVWQQEESEALFSPKVGDTVRVKKGSLGRHDISRVSNGKAGAWARVTRLQ